MVCRQRPHLKTKLRKLSSSTDRSEVSSDMRCRSKNSIFCSSSVLNNSKRNAANTFSPAAQTLVMYTRVSSGSRIYTKAIIANNCEYVPACCFPTRVSNSMPDITGESKLHDVQMKRHSPAQGTEPRIRLARQVNLRFVHLDAARLFLRTLRIQHTCQQQMPLLLPNKRPDVCIVQRATALARAISGDNSQGRSV